MFVDEIWLKAAGGRGGNGAATFRREKYVPLGGADGGDGGDGGSVYLIANPAAASFMDLRYRRHLRAANGGHGRSQNRQGRRGADLLVPVPVGTLVRDEQGRLLADLTRPGQKVLIARGGSGGRGNARFTSSRRRAPRLAEKGQPGEEKKVFLELKLMAQVGLVGLPNAGKSTFLSRVSAARPRVGDYPFTTLAPTLGVVVTGEGGSFVMADLPGLIEGAHQGQGLGHRFLRHVERNLLLLVLIDLSPAAAVEPVAAYRQLLHELACYKEELLTYPRVVAGNKLDLPGAAENLQRLQKEVSGDAAGGGRVWGISAVTGKGVRELLLFLAGEIARLQREAPPREETVLAPVPQEAPLEIDREGDVFVVRGTRVERMAAMTDFENEEALRRFQLFVRRSGLERELIKKGIQEGDTVRIGEEEFYYYPDLL